AEAEDERLEPRRRGGDLLDASESCRLLDQRLEADPLPQTELQLELLEERLEEPHVARRLHLGKDEEIQVYAGALHESDDVVVRPARVGGVHPHRTELLPQSSSRRARTTWSRAASFCAGATASSRSRKTRSAP